ERETAVIAVERGILERLCHHRPGELLHLECKLPIARNAVSGSGWRDEIERERVAQKIEYFWVGTEPLRPRFCNRLIDDGAVAARRAGWSDVGAKDGKMQDEELESGPQPLGGI